MSTIERFEDLEIWKKAREICKYIHPLNLKAEFEKKLSFFPLFQPRIKCLMNYQINMDMKGNKF